MIDAFASLFPSWVPDQAVFVLLGIGIAGVLLVLFPPVPKGSHNKRDMSQK